MQWPCSFIYVLPSLWPQASSFLFKDTVEANALDDPEGAFT